MTPAYINARDVLPPDLLAEVQKHYVGLMKVPSPDTFFDDRLKAILSLRDQGVPSREIARLAGLSHRRVNQILAKEK